MAVRAAFALRPAARRAYLRSGTGRSRRLAWLRYLRWRNGFGWWGKQACNEKFS